MNQPKPSPRTPQPSHRVLELRVRNHPGTMARITALFADDNYNLEAIICIPVGRGVESRMWLLMADSPHLPHVEARLGELHDVLSLRRRADLNPEFFEWMAEMASGAPGSSH